ncbi:MAG TPA: hypothetical protein VF320_11580, partial [Acidimicrobiales bacterium]
SAIARGVPILLAAALCAWGMRRTIDRPPTAAAVIGLTLACLAGRLVFESVAIPYYLLATSVTFLVLDLASRRLPSRSLAWVACSALYVAMGPRMAWPDALVSLALALVALGVGLHDFASGDRIPTAPGVGSTAGIVLDGAR